MSKSSETGLEPVNPTAIPQRRLHTGLTMPAVGLGTFGSDRVSPSEVAAAVKGAAAVGYRHFDCASVYGNEDVVGAALEQVIRGGIKREALWVTSKLWNDKHGEEDVIASCRKSLADLRLDYLDLYLVHWPFPNFHPPGCDVTSRSPNAKPYIHQSYMKTWRKMEELVDLKLVRHIGTSNMTVPKLKLVLRDARIKPAVNEMELHPHFQQPELFRFVVENGVQPIGYCPLGSPGRPDRDRTPDDTTPMEDPVIVEIAKRHGIHPASCLHQVGGEARPDADSVFGQSAQLRRQSAGRRRRSAERRRDAGDRWDRSQLPSDQRSGLLVEGRADLGRPLGRQRRDHAAITPVGARRRSRAFNPRRRRGPADWRSDVFRRCSSTIVLSGARREGRPTGSPLPTVGWRSGKMRCRVSAGRRPLLAGHAASIARRSKERGGFLGA